MDRLAGRGELTNVDLRRIYAGAFLSFYTYVERSLERLFIGLLMRRFDTSGTEPLIDIRSENVARAVLLGTRSYMDWLPFDLYTLRRAQAFLAGGRPFSSVPRADRHALDRLGVIRNAVAHESSHALRTFRRQFVDGKALPPDQRGPSGYLRGQHALGVTRLNYMFAEASNVFARMCK